MFIRENVDGENIKYKLMNSSLEFNRLIYVIKLKYIVLRWYGWNTKSRPYNLILFLEDLWTM